MTKTEIKHINACYTKEHQMRMLMEECAELIQATNKVLRYPNSQKARNNLIEEMADVTIMIALIKDLYDITFEEYLCMENGKWEKVLDRAEVEEKEKTNMITKTNYKTGKKAQVNP